MTHLILKISTMLCLMFSIALAEDEVIMESKRWSVSKTDLNADLLRESCQAQTINSGTKNLEDVEAILKVVNLRNGLNGQYNEPMVVLTVESIDIDLSDMITMSLRTSGDRTDYEMDLISSRSSATKRVFVSKVGERKSLIDKLAAKNTVTAKFFKGVDLIDSTVFSLSGSYRAIKGRDNDSSLKNSCGGVDIMSVSI